MSKHFPLRNHIVMIVEDDPLIGLNLAMTLDDAGADIRGPYRSAAAALEALKSFTDMELPHAALLDVDLGGHTSESVARHLSQVGIAFVFHTAQTPVQNRIFDGISVPIIRKPSTEDEIVSAIAAIVTS